jgi:hypothetical protein
MVSAAAENVLRALRGEPPLYVRNPEALPPWRARVGAAGVGAVGDGLGKLEAVNARRPGAAQSEAGVEDVDLEQQQGAGLAPHGQHFRKIYS